MVSYLSKFIGRTFTNTVLILIVMDNGLLLVAATFDGSNREVLILIVMDNGLLLWVDLEMRDYFSAVLILIVMDNGLLQADYVLSLSSLLSLNPYCNG